MPRSTLHPGSAPGSHPDDSLALEVESLISTLGVDTSSMELEAPEPVAQEGLGQFAIASEVEDDGFEELDVDVDAIWEKEQSIDPEVHAAEIALVEAHAKARLAAEIAAVKANAAAERQSELAQLEAEGAARTEAAVAEARAQMEVAARESLAAQLARLEAEGEARREAAVTEARAQAEAAARESLQFELHRLQHEAAAKRNAAVTDARAQAEQTAREALNSEFARLGKEAAARRDAAVEEARAQAETASREPLQSELERLAPGEAARASLAEELARQDVEAAALREAAVEETRVRAEATARASLQRELERLRTEASALRDTAVADARAQAEVASRESMVAEVERVKSETEAQLRRELEHARADLGAVRAEAMREARVVAEQAAAHALQDEVARVRAETEARLTQELGHVREQAESARRLQQQAQQQAESMREQTARDVQMAAQKAAARAFEVEAVRIRAEAEARLTEETERARYEAQVLVESELIRMRADHEQRHAAEMADVREQMSQLQQAARAAQATTFGPEDAHGGTAQASIARRAEEMPAWAPHLSGGPAASAGWQKWAMGGGALAVLALAAFFALPRVMVGSPETSAAATSTSPDPVISADLTTALNAAAASGLTAAPAETAAAPRLSATRSATVTIFSPIPLDVWEEGRRIAATSEGALVMSPGQHRLELTNHHFNYQGDLIIKLEPGQTLSRTVLLPTGQLRVRGLPGTDVYVEGERIGTMPVADVNLPIGMREVVFRHPQYGDRRQVVEVLAGTPADVTAPFGTPSAAEAATVLRESAAASPVRAGAAQPKLATLSASSPPRSDAVR